MKKAVKCLQEFLWYSLTLYIYREMQLIISVLVYFETAYVSNVTNDTTYIKYQFADIWHPFQYLTNVFFQKILRYFSNNHSTFCSTKISFYEVPGQWFCTKVWGSDQHHDIFWKKKLCLLDTVGILSLKIYCTVEVINQSLTKCLDLSAFWNFFTPTNLLTSEAHSTTFL